MLKTKILVFLMSMLPLWMSAQNCAQPMSQAQFKQQLNQLALQPNDQAKMQFAKTFLPNSCLLSAQIRDMAIVFAGDYYRFEFCKKASRRNYDPKNFYDVYDAFTKLSNAIRLYDFVNRPEINSDPVPPEPSNWYPELSYPMPGVYNGVKGCALPLADKDFEFIVKPVLVQQNDASRRSEAMRLIAAGNCFSMGQLMKLATLLELESNRLAFMKEAFMKIYDMENFSYGTEVFSHIPYRNEWIAYCSPIVKPVINTPPPAPVCEVSAEEFAGIKTSINNVSVNSTKVTLAKQIISTKKCFTVKQLAGIIQLFSVESSRLEIALYSYDYCINTGDYYQLTESLSTTSSKNKLLEFIQTK
jgi:hypothetical protein